jgi:hypothetical protein
MVGSASVLGMSRHPEDRAGAQPGTRAAPDRSDSSKPFQSDVSRGGIGRNGRADETLSAIKLPQPCGSSTLGGA